MPIFTQDSTSYEYLRPSRFKDHEEVQSWEYGSYPKVLASVQLASGGTVDVYAHATRWSNTHVCTIWVDQTSQTFVAWVPKDNVRRATDSEWDIDQYRRCHPDNRVIRWGDRLPGFLPE
jgi:hypothetical protein